MLNSHEKIIPKNYKILTKSSIVAATMALSTFSPWRVNVSPSSINPIASGEIFNRCLDDLGGVTSCKTLANFRFSGFYYNQFETTLNIPVVKCNRKWTFFRKRIWECNGYRITVNSMIKPYRTWCDFVFHKSPQCEDHYPEPCSFSSYFLCLCYSLLEDAAITSWVNFILIGEEPASTGVMVGPMVSNELIWKKYK